MPSFEKFDKPEEPAEINIDQIVEKEQDLHIQLAKEYLPEGDWLREQIIDYYSDTERLKEELANVYEGMSEKEASERIEKKRYTYSNKKEFIERFQKLFEKIKRRRREQRRSEEEPLATEREYELGVYKDALERQVQDAVFKLFDKGYKTFESGFRENTKRDQYIGMYNKKAEVPEELKEGFKQKGFKISEKYHEDRTIIQIHPLTNASVRLDEWKKLWDEFAERMPEAPEEDLSDTKEYTFHREFRDRQDKLRQ